MKQVLMVFGAVGLGATLMYLLDPDRGNRRRALIRDKVGKLNRQTQDAVTGRMKDMGNRAKGMLHDAKSMFQSGEESQQQEPQPATFS